MTMPNAKAGRFQMRPLHGPSTTASSGGATADWQVLLERIYQSALDEFLQPDISADVSDVTWYLRKAHEEFRKDPSLDVTPLALLRRARYMFEFSIRDRRFHSRLIPLGNREETKRNETEDRKFKDVIERMQACYLDPNRV